MSDQYYNTANYMSPKGSLGRRSSNALDSNTNLRVKEGQHINKSLFFLTQVIALKAESGRKGGSNGN